MTEENLKLGIRKMENIQELRLFLRKLEDTNSSVLIYENAKLAISRGSDLYVLLTNYLITKIAALEEDFANFDALPAIDADGEHE